MFDELNFTKIKPFSLQKKKKNEEDENTGDGTLAKI